MTEHDEAIDAQFDALIAELEVQEVETSGPSNSPNGLQDLDDTIAALGAIEGIGPATLAKVTPGDDLVRTVRGAIEWGRDQMIQRVAIYAGLCLMFVRMCFNLDPLAPDAITAWDMSTTKRPCSANAARRGHAGFFRGGEHGHVVLCLGNGRCLSNDTGKPGTINVALIADIERAWGYKFLGDVDSFNGERAPRSTRSPRRHPISDHAYRVRFLRQAIARSRQAGNHARTRRLRDWLSDVQRRQAAR